MSVPERLQKEAAMNILARVSSMERIMTLNALMFEFYITNALGEHHVKAYYLFLKAYNTQNKLYLTRQAMFDAIALEAQQIREKTGEIFLSTRPNDLEPIITELLIKKLILKAPLEREKKLRPTLHVDMRKNDNSYQPKIHTRTAYPSAVMELMDELNTKSFHELNYDLSSDQVLELLSLLVLKQGGKHDYWDTLNEKNRLRNKNVPTKELCSNARASLLFLGIKINDIYQITSVQDHSQFQKKIAQAAPFIIEEWEKIEKQYGGRKK